MRVYSFSGTWAMKWMPYIPVEHFYAVFEKTVKTGRTFLFEFWISLAILFNFFIFIFILIFIWTFIWILNIGCNWMNCTSSWHLRDHWVLIGSRIESINYSARNNQLSIWIIIDSAVAVAYQEFWSYLSQLSNNFILYSSTITKKDFGNAP